MATVQGSKIWIVTSSHFFGQFAARLLTRWGYQTIAFSEFAAASHCLKTDCPDLLLSGWVFGETTASEPLLQISRDYPDLPIVIWSGDVPPASLPWPRLHKPGKVLEVRGLLEKILSK